MIRIKDNESNIIEHPSCSKTNYIYDILIIWILNDASLGVSGLILPL